MRFFAASMLLAIGWILRPVTAVDPAAVAAVMAHLDTDGDGVLSPVEFLTVADPLLSFDVIDQDGDRTLSLPEVESAMMWMHP